MPVSVTDRLALTIDQGGQSTRTLVFNRHLQIVAEAAVPISTYRPRPGWVEQDPHEILASISTCLARITTGLGRRIGHIDAAGLATQRSSVVCWNRESGTALSPVLSWQDRRGESQIRAVRSAAAKVRRRTGLVLSAHYGASKLRWCLDHLPAVRAAMQAGRLACGPLASFLLFHLCSERPLVVDPAIAARTLLWDCDRADWSPDLLELFGVPRSVLVDSVTSRYEFGNIELAAMSVPLTVSTGDQAAALFAEGLPEANTAYVNLGTGAFVQRLASPDTQPPEGLLLSMVWRDGARIVRTLEGSINGCGSALEQQGSSLGLGLDTIASEADDWLRQPGEPPLFLNGISGLGSPFWVADYPTAVIGAGEPRQVMVAVIESIVFLLQLNLEAMNRPLGPACRLRVAGGLAGIDGICRRLADLSGIETVRSPVREATARGLARLLDDFPESASGDPRSDSFLPRSDPRLAARFDRWVGQLEARLPATA